MSKDRFEPTQTRRAGMYLDMTMRSVKKQYPRRRGLIGRFFLYLTRLFK